MAPNHAADGGPHPPEALDIAKFGTEQKPIKVTITADLFRISMKLVTGDNYSASYTLAVRPQAKGPLGFPRLLYLYQNETSVPVNTDSSSHVGAAFLDIKKEPSGQLTMEGLYWTGRNWTKGLNTAGQIVLRRA